VEFASFLEDLRPRTAVAEALVREVEACPCTEEGDAIALPRSLWRRVREHLRHPPRRPMTDDDHQALFLYVRETLLPHQAIGLAASAVGADLLLN